MKIKCEYCDNKFEPRQKFCSHSCYSKHKKDLPNPTSLKHNVICLICNKKFWVKPSHVKGTKYCSSECYHTSQLGKRHNKETIEKMRSVLNTGQFKKIPGSTYRYEKRHSPELRRWRLDVLRRDNHFCRLTKDIENLEVHHLDNFCNNKDKRTDIDNGITLTKNIHNMFHSIFGNKTYRNDFLKFRGIMGI